MIRQSIAAALATAVSLCFAGAVQAASVTIDFSSAPAEGTAVGTIGIATFSGAISADPLGSLYAFRTDAGVIDTVSSSDVGGRFVTDLIPSGGDFGNYAGPIVIDFAQSVLDVSFYILDLNYSGHEIATVRIENAGGIVDQVVFNESSVITPFTGSGTLGVRGDATAALVDFNNAIGITRLTIDVTSDATNGRLGFGVDNLSFTPVPLPAAAPLFLAALVGVGLIGRSRSGRDSGQASTA